MLSRLRDRIGGYPIHKAAWSTGARVPDGERVYVVGDIHGRSDLLRKLHQSILTDAQRRPGPAARTIAYLGDYIDRGPGSCEVLDILIREPLAGFRSVHLKGNHEDLLIRFLAGKTSDGNWLYNGGDATLASYGIEASWAAVHPAQLEALRQRLDEAMPPEHLKFLNNLSLYHVTGDYLLVHAGIRPGVPLDLQRPTDLIWIREPFLLSQDDFGKRVVHGHTISRQPDVRYNRIGIDTGAFYTGSLSCLILEGEEVAFLSS